VILKVTESKSGLFTNFEGVFVVAKVYLKCFVTKFHRSDLLPNIISDYFFPPFRKVILVYLTEVICAWKYSQK
jgi:hypothetical protein